MRISASRSSDSKFPPMRQSGQIRKVLDGDLARDLEREFESAGNRISPFGQIAIRGKLVVAEGGLCSSVVKGISPRRAGIRTQANAPSTAPVSPQDDPSP